MQDCSYSSGRDLHSPTVHTQPNAAWKSDTVKVSHSYLTTTLDLSCSCCLTKLKAHNCFGYCMLLKICTTSSRMTKSEVHEYTVCHGLSGNVQWPHSHCRSLGWSGMPALHTYQRCLIILMLLWGITNLHSVAPK